MKTKDEQRYELVKNWLPSIVGAFETFGKPMDGKVIIDQTIKMADYAISRLSEEKKERKASVSKPILDRLKDFRSEVDRFSTTYPKTMLDSFYLYWSETNKSKTKMRWELQSTFDVSRRLITWDSRSKDDMNMSADAYNQYYYGSGDDYKKSNQARKEIDSEYEAFKKKYEK